MNSRLLAGLASWFAAGLLLAPPASPQNLIAFDGPGLLMSEGVAMSPLYPGAGVPLAAFPAPVPVPPAPAPGPFPAGAVTHDATTGLLWYTDGTMIINGPHAAYPPTAAPLPFPILPPPFFGGPITGMAIDAVGGVLWITDGLVVTGIAPLPGPAVVLAPPFPVLGPVGPLTGLDWDPLTGSLWAVDLGGLAVNFVPGGALLAPPIGPLPVPAPTGIAIDKTGLPGPGGAPRPLYVCGPAIVVEAFTGVAFPSFAPGGEVGLTFHSAPQPMPPAPCPCPTFPIGQTLLGPAVSGNAGFGVSLVGLPPGNATWFLFDPAGFNPAFPMLNASGCAFGLNFASMFGVFAPASAAGVASVATPLTTIPPGALFYMQIVTLCPADPAGFALSPVYQIAVSAP